MFKKILLLGLFISFTNLFSQHTLTGQMKPANKKYTWAILYKLNGVNQKYVNNLTIENGKFSVEIPKNSPAGMYRLLYDNANNKYLDFIYNNEDVTVEFHPDSPSQLVKYEQSQENIIYQKFIDKTSILQNKLDSIQVVYFQTKDKSHENNLNKLYKKELTELIKIQKSFDTDTKDKLANNFIVASKRYYSKDLIKNTNDYLTTIKTHYFDNVDFDNPILKKSSLLIDRVMDYVFYLNTSNDKNTLVKLRKEGIDTVISKIPSDDFKKDVIESLLYTLAQQEDLELVDYIFKNHFTKLPISLQDYEFKELIKDMLKTSLGNKAPDIVWKEKDKTKNLYSLKEHKYYLVVFWSTTCSHCLKQMPVLQKYLEDKPEVQVIAVAIETNNSKVTWTDEKYYYEEFKHVLALSSDEDSVYKSSYVKDYGVNATPSFFLLNSDKTIIAKPYDVKELEKIYPAISKDTKEDLKKK